MENNLFEVSYVNGKKTERAIVPATNPDKAKSLVTEILTNKGYDFSIGTCTPIIGFFPDWNNGTGERIVTMPLKTATHGA